MDRNGNVRGMISCLVSILIMIVVLKVLSKVAFLIIPAIVLLNLLRAWLWHRRIKKAQEKANQFVQQKKKEESPNYCEAEFEILDDDSDG